MRHNWFFIEILWEWMSVSGKISRDKKIGFSFLFFWGGPHYEQRKGKASGLVARDCHLGLRVAKRQPATISYTWVAPVEQKRFYRQGQSVIMTDKTEAKPLCNHVQTQRAHEWHSHYKK